MASTRFAICLFEPGITELDPAELIVGEKLRKVNFTGNTDKEALLFQRKSEASLPGWVEIVQEFGEFNAEDLMTATSGAILFLKINDRILGCCFGSSVANINRNNIETDFGLGVVFQKMLKSQTKSIESFSLTTNPMTSNRVAAMPTIRTSFNVDEFLENITELTGYFFKEKRRTLIKGKEFYSSPAPSSLQSIVSLCGSCLEDYSRALENEDFKRLTSTRRIKDKKQIEELDKELCRRLNKEEEFFLVDHDALPNIYSYKLTPNSEGVEELSIEDIYDSFRSNQQVTVDFLKRRKIFPCDENDEELANWPLYKCLFLEIELGGQTFVFYKGRWYEVDSDYLSGLRTFLEAFEVEPDFLPEWESSESEGDYNERAAVHISGQCWDKMLYTSDQYSYGIEFCDILSDDYIFHVKKYESSKLNSHLLFQTAVSAQLLSTDPRLKSWIVEKGNEVFGGNLLLNDDFSLKREKPCYFILLLSDRKERLVDILPFFSLISFNLLIKKVTQLGFDVKIGRV